MFEWINSSIKNYIISIVEKEFFESGDDDKLKIQKLNNNAIIPVKATKLAAGYDLYSIDSITIPPLSRVLVNIGLSIKTPEGTYGRIAPRSGMSLNGVDVGGGVIDQDYTGPLKVILINNNEDEFKVVEGMKVAQLVCEKICLPEIQIVDKLEQTERGSNGFGSTGILNSADQFQKTQINKKFEFITKPQFKFTTNDENKSEPVEEKSEKLNEEVKKEN
jgi:dUTP pyrophosphatase